MASNLTGSTIANTYNQLLHVDGGPEATPKTVFSGTGVATAVKVGTLGAEVGNIRFVGNTVSSVNVNGDMNFTPNGTGSVVISKVTFSDATQARTALSLGSMATQDSDDIAITGGTISGVVFSGSFTGLTLIESATLATSDAAAGVNLNGNTLAADGTDTDIDINITPKGTGTVNMSSKFGYATGTGGTVTQLTSKSTAVTLNNLSGQITMDDAQLNRNSGVSFTLNNSFISASDVVLACIASGATTTAYTLDLSDVSAGSCSFHLHNHLTGTDLSEAVVLNFIVIKGVTS